jgi:rRNA maturation endonuclease Nob1
MQVIVCRYCRSEVSLSDIEREGGACPECGATIPLSRLYDDDDDEVKDDEFDETLIDDDEDDDDLDDE